MNPRDRVIRDEDVNRIQHCVCGIVERLPCGRADTLLCGCGLHSQQL